MNNPRRLSHSGLPDEFKKKIQEISGAKNVDYEILVIRKRLSAADINQEQNSFFMPSIQIRSTGRNFLNTDELAHLRMVSSGGEHFTFLRVMSLDPNLTFSTFFLKIWNVQNSGENVISYVLTVNWNEIVARNNLQDQEILQLWAIRVGGNLWFVLRK
ncbi:hypothetical protein ACH5RR_002821 [Cinchona calisaya]|uniref:Uncharacterized protein n=1 Tax=Cinchona calisaya TaxID=153742 RepID=A0ABD3AT31_9GENT